MSIENGSYEEIVKALKYTIAQREPGEPDGIGFWKENYIWVEFSMKDVLNFINHLHDENERLMEERDVFKKLFEACNNSSITTEQIIDTMNSFYREQAEHLTELKIEQAEQRKAREVLEWLKSKVVTTEIPHGSEPCEEDVEAVMWWQIEEYFKRTYDVEVE